MKSLNFITIALLLFFFLSGFSQERKIKKKNSTNFIEVYSVDKKTKRKDGVYLKLNKLTNDTLISGNFSNNTKSGLWRYFDNSKNVYLTYNYDNQHLNQISPEISASDSFYIKKDSIFTLEKVDSPPIYLGYKDEFGITMNQNIVLPVEIIENKIIGFCVSTFVVDKQGKMKDIRIEKSLNKKFNQNIIQTLKTINGDWIPAKLNGKPVESKTYLFFDVSQFEKKRTFKEKPYLQVFYFSFLGITKTIRMRAF
ncbi:MAG TPA: energy transducer TonB [Paludibacter sp.]|nr:energy transducer TonB [Paludibacter sp.]